MDVAENRDFTSLSHEMEMPMAEIARHMGDVDQASLTQFKKWSQRIKIHRFHQRSSGTHCEKNDFFARNGR